MELKTSLFPISIVAFIRVLKLQGNWGVLLYCWVKCILYPRNNWELPRGGEHCRRTKPWRMKSEGSGGGATTLWVRPSVPHTLGREAETVTNTLWASDGKEDFIFVTHLRDTYKCGIASKNSCFTPWQGQESEPPGNVCTGPCPCPILSSTLGDSVMPSRLLPTCSEPLDLPSSLSPTVVLSHWWFHFLEHKKPGSCQCSGGRCVLPLGLVFYPEHHLRTDTGGYIWANPDKLLAFSLQINSACPGGFWTMPALPEECSSHL